jgi:DNA mismatch endonuclease, patch repair protein
MQARAILRQLGLSGYRLHRKDLPGRPDIAFIGERRAMFVNGCFWHQHDCTVGQRAPKKNSDFWAEKLGRNSERDRRKVSELRSLGWKVVTIWECEFDNLPALVMRIGAFMRS